MNKVRRFRINRDCRARAMARCTAFLRSERVAVPAKAVAATALYCLIGSLVYAYGRRCLSVLGVKSAQSNAKFWRCVA